MARGKRKSRPVDGAMAADRPAKAAVRRFWINSAVIAHQTSDDSVPLYLTLGGAAGTDISLLAQEGVIALTEVNSIAPASQRRVVAIENSPPAVAALQRKYPGLKILQVAVKDLVRGEGPTAFPTGDHEHCCRARIINLDLNSALATKADNGQISFPLITWIRKLSQLHAKPPRIDWILMLTLHGEITWDAASSENVRSFLAENFVREPQYGQKCRALLGNELHGAIATTDAAVRFAELDRSLQQCVLMAFVPKKIAHVVQGDGWRLETRRNLRYGDVGEAPIVTWEMAFIADPRTDSVPDEVYRESLRSVLAAPGSITPEGSVVEIALQ